MVARDLRLDIGPKMTVINCIREGTQDIASNTRALTLLKQRSIFCGFPENVCLPSLTKESTAIQEMTSWRDGLDEVFLSELERQALRWQPRKLGSYLRGPKHHRPALAS